MTEAVDVPSTSKEQATIGLTRRTKRVPARPPSSSGQPLLASKDQEDIESALAGSKTRRWETWEAPEQGAFFDAVKQVGKDFDAIVRLMAKRKMKKDKEQIRNYYYNTYKQTKLNAGFADEHPSDNFAFPVPREAKELFVLVNLAEWRKKTSDRKIEATKFRELVLKGSTSVRLKGKRVPVLIKTPACPALKKFCEEPSKKRQKPMPTDVTLELVPKSFCDKAYVLRCEQNPFLRLKLSVSETLRHHFDFVRHKWIPSDLRLREEYLGEEIAQLLPDIRFLPDSSVKMGRVVIQHADVLPTICLRLCSEICEQQPGLFTKEGKKKPHQLTAVTDANATAVTCTADETDSDTNDAESAVPIDNQIDSSVPVYTSQLSSETSSGEQEPSLVQDDNATAGVGDESKEDSNPISKESAVVLDEAKLAQGLTIDNVGNVTAAELCLTCNAASVIRLTYSITPPKAATRADPWKLFMTVVTRNYGEHVYKSLNTVEQSGPTWVNSGIGQKTPGSADFSNKKRTRVRGDDGQSPCTPMMNGVPHPQLSNIRNNIDVGLMHRIGLNASAVDLMPSSDEKKNNKSRASKQIQLPPTTLTRAPATVVSGENEAFAWQIAQLSKGKRVIKASVQPNPVGLVCRQVVGIGSVKNDTITPGQSISTPPIPTMVSTATPHRTQPTPHSEHDSQRNPPADVLASPATDALQKTPDRAQRKRKAAEKTEQQPRPPAMLDFSTLGGLSSSSTDGQEACSSSAHAASSSDHHQSGNSRMTLTTPGHSVDAFSPLKAMSNLPDDVRYSFEMMMQQSSIDYCRNFEALAETLETPKKHL